MKKIIKFRIEEKLLEEFKTACKNENMSMEEVLRTLVDKYTKWANNKHSKPPTK